MHVTEPGDHEPILDFSVKLADVLTSVDESTRVTEAAVLSFIEQPANPQQMVVAFSGQIISIRSAMSYVVESSEYSDEEKAAMVATLLTKDDEKRVNFFKDVCGEEDSESFAVGYDDFDKVKRRIGLVLNVSSPHLGYGVCVDDLLTQHGELLGADLNSFLQSNFVKNILKDQELQKERRQKVIQIATTAAGVLVGTLTANFIMRKKKQ